MNTTPQMIGSAAAAQRLGVSRGHFNKLVAMGAIRPVVSMDGRTGARLFDPAVIDTYRANIKAAS